MTQVIICFCGLSNSGKTTVINKIISKLTAKGYRVGAIKHAKGGIDLNFEPAKDSISFLKSKAQGVLVFSDKFLSFSSRLDEEIEVEDLINRYFLNFDLVILEGFKETKISKVLVLDEDKDLDLTNLKNVIAVFGSRKIKKNIPLFSKDEVDKLIDFIERRIVMSAPRERINSYQCKFDLGKG